jgi:hypothetical protein
LPSNGAQVLLPTASQAIQSSPAPCAAALIFGTLVPSDTTGVSLLDADTGQLRKIVFPNGYVGRRQGDRIAVVDASGAIIALTGDAVAIGGGEIDESGAWNACGDIVVR